MDSLVREDLDDDSYQIREVYAQYGLAMYNAQVLESGLVNVLAIARGNDIPGATVNDYDHIIDMASGKTMGAVLGLLRPHLGGDPQLDLDLREGVRMRNHLAHSFFSSHVVGFLSVDGREVMLAELHAATEQFERLDDRLEPVLDRFLGAHGIDTVRKAELIRDATSELMQRYEDAAN